MLKAGDAAPALRLPSAGGPDVALGDYRGRAHVVVWFSKGMACPFCRTQMSHLGRAYPRLRGLNADVLHVTPTPPDRARMYHRRFRFEFPYLCDPEYATWQAWGLALRPHTARFLRHPDHPPSSRFGTVHQSPLEWNQLMAEEDGGFFVVDRAGIIRHAQVGSVYAGGWRRLFPPVDAILQIVRECELLEGPAPSSA